MSVGILLIVQCRQRSSASHSPGTLRGGAADLPADFKAGSRPIMRLSNEEREEAEWIVARLCFLRNQRSRGELSADQIAETLGFKGGLGGTPAQSMYTKPTQFDHDVDILLSLKRTSGMKMAPLLLGRPSSYSQWCY